MALIICVGVPGSGKSTVVAARGGDAVVVSPDSVRSELCGTIADQSHNSEVFELAYQLVRQGLESGRDVIFDATALQPAVRDALARIADSCGAERVAWRFDVDAEVAVERNRSRGGDVVVPDDVMGMMLDDFAMFGNAEQLRSEGWAVVTFDSDGHTRREEGLWSR